MIKQYGKKFKKILVDVIGEEPDTSNHGSDIVVDVMKFFGEIYTHLLKQWERFQEWYRE